MYYIDTPTMRVTAFDYDGPTGENFKPRRTVIQFPEGVGRPDGMTVDADGKLWIAHWDGGRVIVGIQIRAGCWKRCCCLSAVSRLAFSVGSWLDELYITTARQGLDNATLAAAVRRRTVRLSPGSPVYRLMNTPVRADRVGFD